MEMVGQELMFIFFSVYKTIVVVLLLRKYNTTTISIRYTLSKAYLEHLPSIARTRLKIPMFLQC